MIIKIDKKEQDSFSRNCIDLRVQVSFYTIETNSRLITAVILDDGKEITLDKAYTIGRITGMEKLSETFK